MKSSSSGCRGSFVAWLVIVAKKWDQGAPPGPGVVWMVGSGWVVVGGGLGWAGWVGVGGAGGWWGIGCQLKIEERFTQHRLSHGSHQKQIDYEWGVLVNHPEAEKCMNLNILQICLPVESFESVVHSEVREADGAAAQEN